MQVLVEAEFDGGEEVVAAAEGEAISGEAGVGGVEEIEDGRGWHGRLVIEGGELPWDLHRVDGAAGEVEEGVGGETGAGAVGLPLVLEEAGIGVEVAEGGGIGRAGDVGAVFGVGAVVVLGPETVEDEAEVLGALGFLGVGGAELGRPGEVEEVEVEVAGVAGGGTGVAAVFPGPAGLTGEVVGAVWIPPGRAGDLC